ncbi:MAG: hypothetical protein DWQ36_16045 [Acidobacteria bacterium]|nr:MAG: hypothetical protein DWQ30_20450 [Acidobacteriota bacterium]REK05622.1 MAG: hypothetical protein DWQ36_16045 [Acidobacteriota bacterium]
MSLLRAHLVFVAAAVLVLALLAAWGVGAGVRFVALVPLLAVIAALLRYGWRTVRAGAPEERS